MVNHNIDRTVGMSASAVAGHELAKFAEGNTAKNVMAKYGSSYTVVMVMALMPVLLGGLFYVLVEYTSFGMLAGGFGVLAVIAEIALAPIQVLAVWKTLVLLVKLPFKLLGGIARIVRQAVEARQRAELDQACNEARSIIEQVKKDMK